MKGRIIFLDIDGVLNCRSSLTREHAKYKNSFILAVENCKVLSDFLELEENKDIKIVISSTWRYSNTPGKSNSNDVRYALAKYGYSNIANRIIGCTDTSFKYGPDLWSTRSDEILKWMWDNEFIGQFVILDDELCHLENLKEFVVKTNYHSTSICDGGLRECHIELIEEILEEQ